jgi:uncharacterized damage-inducible protein DinB
MWLSRINKTEFTCTIFQERTLLECEQLMLENKKGCITFLESTTTETLESEIEFLSAWEVNPRKRSMSIMDAMVHLINHSSVSFPKNSKI